MANYALLSDLPPEEYEAWLVKNLETLRKYRPRALALVALPGAGVENTSTLTGYYMADLEDKHLMAAAINDDAMDQLVRANLDQYLDELEELDEEDEEDEGDQ